MRYRDIIQIKKKREKSTKYRKTLNNINRLDKNVLQYNIKISTLYRVL